MMTLKQEGHQFLRSHENWIAPHPARWCFARYLAAAWRTGNIAGPFGEMWSCDGHNWTCYIRFRRHMIGKVPWHQLWEHRHSDFRDILAMGSLVNGAEDPYICGHYEVTLHTVEGKVVPWPKDARMSI